MAVRKDVTLAMNSTFDSSGIRNAQASLNGLSGVVSNVGRAMATVGTIAAAGFVAASAGAVMYFKDSIGAAAEAQSAFLGLSQAVKNSTGFAEMAGGIDKATKALDDHSTKLAELTGLSDETINQTKAAWLAVPDLAQKGVSGINNLAQITADIAAGTGKDFQTIALAFAKVTGDEETALGKLVRAGIVLSDSQKETYQNILDTNGEIAAQDYLIAELGKKYEGMAVAAANPLERIKQVFENMQEAVGAAFLPVLNEFIPALSKAFEDLRANPEFQKSMQDLSDALVEIAPQLVALIPQLIQLAVDILPDVVQLFMDLTPVLIELAPAILDILKLVIPLVQQWSQWVGWIFTGIDGLGRLFSGKANMRDFLETMRQKAEEATGPFRFLLETLQNIANLIGIVRNSNPSVNAPLIASQIRGGMNYTFAPGSSYPGQAAGGITTSPGLSWVGEKGPELLSLPRGAQVTPLDKMGGNSYNITVNAGMGTSGAQVGEEIVNAIRKYERTSGQVFARA